jgi:hypothetical protein
MNVCEQLFSEMKMVKSKSKNRLDDEKLERCLLVPTSYIRQGIENLVLKKQWQAF